MAHPWPFGAGLTATDLNAAIQVGVVNAGTNLSASRPADFELIFWKFSAGVDVGTNGANIVNALPGDMYFVADS